jgi:hypothetical protein
MAPLPAGYSRFLSVAGPPEEVDMEITCVIHGQRYDLELGRAAVELFWEHGVVFFLLRETQFPNIIYIRVYHVNSHWPFLHYAIGVTERLAENML